MSVGRGCPHCDSLDTERVRRHWWERVLRRKRVYFCCRCHHRFVPAAPPKAPGRELGS